MDRFSNKTVVLIVLMLLVLALAKMAFASTGTLADSGDSPVNWMHAPLALEDTAAETEAGCPQVSFQLSHCAACGPAFTAFKPAFSLPMVQALARSDRLIPDGPDRESLFRPPIR